MDRSRVLLVQVEDNLHHLAKLLRTAVDPCKLRDLLLFGDLAIELADHVEGVYHLAEMDGDLWIGEEVHFYCEVVFVHDVLYCDFGALWVVFVDVGVQEYS